MCIYESSPGFSFPYFFQEKPFRVWSASWLKPYRAGPWIFLVALKRAIFNCNFSPVLVMKPLSKKSLVQIYTQRMMFWAKVKLFQCQCGHVKMPIGGPRHFDRRWATCLGSRELLIWWQTWAGQAQQGKRVAHRLSKWPTKMEIYGTTPKLPISFWLFTFFSHAGDTFWMRITLFLRRLIFSRPSWFVRRLHRHVFLDAKPKCRDNIAWKKVMQSTSTI